MEEIGITQEDMEQIKNYLEKPPHRRDLNDLVPDENETSD